MLREDADMGTFGMLMGYDIYFLLLVIPAFILSLGVQFYLKSTYRKMSLVYNAIGITGAQAAAQVLTMHGVSNVGIAPVPGTLSDHFDPRTGVIGLSEGVYSSTSVAAIGIACHEAGHAVQHQQSYGPIKIRNAFLPIANIGSALGLPLAVVGFMMGFNPLITIGLVLYSLIAVFQLITLPVELNASKRAIDAIEAGGMLAEDEKSGAKKVLYAAALTYVAALAVSLANLLRLVLRFRGRR